MAKGRTEEKSNMEAEIINADLDFDLDEEALNTELKEVSENKIKMTEIKEKTSESSDRKYSCPVSCLRKERIIVRHIQKESGMVTNPKHVLYGGMAENAVITFIVPRLSSGMYVNVLTDNEKAYLEEVMGLEYNALSIYKKENNFWDDSSDNGVSKVRLHKQDNYFDLSNPEDYIRYKILLANKDYIAPSIQAMQDKPKATYKFVIISEGDENKTAKDNMSATMKCYKEFGKIENDADTLRVIIETIDGRPTAATTKLDFLQTRINSLIQADSKIFLKVISDPLLSTKVLIKKSIEEGLISKRGDYLYLTKDNTPLCELNEEPTLNIAAKYLNLPKHQNTKFYLEAKLKQ